MSLLEQAEVHLRIGVPSRRDPTNDVRQIRALIAIRKSVVCLSSNVMKGNGGRLYGWTRGNAGDSSRIFMAKDSPLKRCGEDPNQGWNRRGKMTLRSNITPKFPMKGLRKERRGVHVQFGGDSTAEEFYPPFAGVSVNKRAPTCV